MRSALIAIALSFVSAAAAAGASLDYGGMSTAQLVDALQDVATPAPGLGDAGIFGGFIGDGSPPRFEGGLLGRPAPPAPAGQMRELVRRGANALPALLEHLDDARPSRLVLGVNRRAPGAAFGDFMGAYYAQDYLPRTGPPRHGRERLIAPLDDGYRVKVGDLCFVLLGQIVNRPLSAARYQPTAILVINSPLESPVLARWARTDWRGTDAAALRASLLRDVRDDRRPWLNAPALVRLRFYFPDSYRRLTGEAAVKRDRLEAAERASEARRPA